MTSKNKERKLKTLTEEAIITLRKQAVSSLQTRDYLKKKLGIDFGKRMHITSRNLGKALGVGRSMTSRVISALQKRHLLSRPHNRSRDYDPAWIPTSYRVDLDRLLEDDYH